MTIKPERDIVDDSPPSVPYEIGLYEDLKDPEFAAEYLNAIFEGGDPRVVLRALKDVIKANGDIKRIAEQSNMTRQALYTMLSENGNPTFKNFTALLSQIGIKITFSVDEPHKQAS